MSNCCSRTSSRGYSYAFRKITVYYGSRFGWWRRNATRKLPVRGNGFLMGPRIARTHTHTHTRARFSRFSLRCNNTFVNLGSIFSVNQLTKLTAFFVFAFRHRALNLERRYTRGTRARPRARVARHRTIISIDGRKWTLTV